MAKKFESLQDEQIEFIKFQKIFFVGTAMSDGRVNISPKGMDSFRVLNTNRIIWLNLTGSGNETATHLLENNRMTIMFCAFDGKPLILRIYGTCRVYHVRDTEFQNYINFFPANAGSRQIMDMTVDLVQTSCGYGVPLMDFKNERPILKDWAEKQGKGKIKEYWKAKNTISLDGHESNILG